MNKYVWLLGALVVVFFYFRNSVRAGETAGGAWEKINAGAVLIDVRTAGEFNSGHLEGALNIPYEKTDELIRAIGTNTARSVVLYCRTGRRSGLAQQVLQERGFTDVLNAGGYSDLRAREPKP